MLQGDQYNIDFKFSTDGVAITDADLAELEITVGDYTKKFSDGINYSNGAWHYPITQTETFALRAHMQPVQARLKFLTGEVIGVTGDCIRVEEAISKAVI